MLRTSIILTDIKVFKLGEAGANGIYKTKFTEQLS